MHIRMNECLIRVANVTTSTYKFCTYNINGLRGKMPELIDIFKHQDIDIAAIAEIHLTPQLRFNVKGYTVYRHNDTPRSGGLALLLKQQIPHSKITKSELPARSDSQAG